MKIHTKATALLATPETATAETELSGLGILEAETELPEGAANVTATHVVCEDILYQIVTWIELSPSERAEALIAAHRGRGIQ